MSRFTWLTACRDRLSNAWKKEVRREPLEKQDAARRKRVDDWIDAGHGCCILREPAVAEMVQSTLLFFDDQRYRLFAWVVMPNHVHVLFQPLSGWKIAKIVGSWKRFTATRICASPRNANLRIGDSVSANAEIGVPGMEIGVLGKEIGDSGGRIWHREYWDRYIRDEVHFRQVVDYIHANPVKSGFVARAEGWRWVAPYGTGTGRPPRPPLIGTFAFSGMNHE